MCRSFASFWVAIASLFLTAAIPPAHAQSPAEISAARYLPQDVSIVLNIRDPGPRWKDIVSSSVMQRVMEIPGVKEGMASDKFRDLRNGQKFIEGMFGKPIDVLIQDFTLNGATLAWKNEREIVLLFKPAPDTFDRLRRTLKEFASAASLANANKGKSPLFSAAYRGVDAYGIEKARIGFCNGWVVACSSSDLGKAVLDRLLGDHAKSVADENWFREACTLTQSFAQGAPPAVTGLANMKEIRADGKFKIPRGIDPGQEMLFGGILDALETTSVVVATAEINGQVAQIQIAIPRQKRTDDHSEYFFGSDQLQPAPRPVEIPNRILSGRWHRDIGLFWKMAPQIIHDENALAGIAKAESDISTLLGGMVTVGDLFQYLGPNVEIVAVRPIANAEKDQPNLKIPAFCLSGTLRDPTKAQPALRLAFQQVVSFANLNASAGMYPPLEVSTEREGSRTLISASYFAMEQSATSGQVGGDLYKNFSPTLGFLENQFVLASHRDLAEQVLTAPKPQPFEVGATYVDNTIVEVWPMDLAAAGDLNREPLIAQRMLSTGQGRDRAAADIDAGIALLKQFASARLRLRASDDSLILDLETRLALDPAATK